MGPNNIFASKLYATKPLVSTLLLSLLMKILETEYNRVISLVVSFGMISSWNQSPMYSYQFGLISRSHIWVASESQRLNMALA